MPSTPRGLVYPATSAAPNVPADMQALAESIESVWDNQPYCVSRNSSTVSLTTATLTAMTLDTDDSDALGMHSTSSNTSRIVAPSAGLYIGTATVNFASNATGVRILTLRKNSGGVGTAGTQLGYIELSAASAIHYMQVQGLISMAANDYLELFAYQNSGGALNAQVTNFSVARFA